MKIKKISLLIISVIILLALLGCHSTSSEVTDANSKTTNGYTPTYSNELKDVNNALNQSNKFVTTLPNEYKLTAEVDLKEESDADRIDYQVAIKEPKTELNNLTMSFSLNPQMVEKLDTSDVFTSNTLSDEPTSYLPQDDTNSIVLARAFILDQAKIDQSMSNIYEEMYVKISYIDNSGEQKNNYIKIKAHPSDKLQKYIAGSIS